MAAPTLKKRCRYVGTTNEFLLDRLRTLNVDASKVVGDVEDLIGCPCCGLATLGGRGVYAICPVCLWEDDGTDNESFPSILPGPNRIDLAGARRNVLLHGVSDPGRPDSIERDPPSKYVRKRKFLFDESIGVVSEPGSDWAAVVTTDR